MKLTLVVIGDGRATHLREAVRTVQQHCTHPISARVMINDEADSDYCTYLNSEYPDWWIVHTGRRGMAGAVQAGFSAALNTDPDLVLWVEEDFLITRHLPIGDAAAILQTHPEIAQMSFRREPLDPVEQELGCVLAAMTTRSVHSTHLNYTVHQWIFSLNPCLIQPEVMRLGWPSGPIGQGNETGFTDKLLANGYTFGSWGHPQDGLTWCTHVGIERSREWRL